MTYYSQFRQDELINTKIFKNKSEGFFVDIGAYDGISQGSNSLFFEQLGWKGICVEPNPFLYKELVKNRKCECYNFAVSNKIGTEDFLYIQKGGPNTLGGLMSGYSNDTGLKQLMDTTNHDIIKVKTELFENIVQNKVIDYLSIDTEGNELKILETIDFEKFDISVMSIEINSNGRSIHELLIEKGYNSFLYLGCDEIFVKNTMIY